jgi:PAS domain S-box-containing protein
MMLTTRVTMSGLVLLTAAVLGLLAYRRVDTAILLDGFAAVAGILVLAVLLVHLLMRPLVRMTAAVQAFTRDANAMAPISAAGEIGVLAGAFQRMAAEVRAKSAALNQESSKRRHAEAELEQYAQRECRFIAVVESAKSPIITKTLDGTITAWNPAAERLYQYTAAEAIGSNIEIIIPADRRAEHLAIVDKVRKEEPIAEIESVRVAKDGRRIDVSLIVSPIKSSAGEIVGVANITRDITALKLAEEKFRLAVESCPSGMVMVDPVGNIVMVNGEIERLFGYPRVELIGQPIDILVPESADHHEQFARQPETRRMGANRELFGVRKDGTEFPVEVRLNPIQTRDELLILSVIVDISERKRIERLKDEFVSTVSHELRTPLTSISASLGLLTGTAAVKLPEATKRLITIAHSNSQRLVRLINDILDVEKIESGKVAFNMQRVEVRSLIGQSIESSRALANGYGVRLRFEELSVHEVRADPDRLMQVVTNLLSNAIKFSPPNAEVVVAIENPGEHVRISVRDHGPGIPEDFRSRIFEKFAQADASNERQKGGTGLGLSIVKQIVLRLGGEVGFSDAPGGGAIFYVDLPRLDTVGHGDAGREKKINGARILLCADDSDTAAVMRDRLCQAGFTTDLSHTSADAIAQATMAVYSAILVVPQLRDGDGISLIQKLRAQPQYGDTPIVVVSAIPGRGRDDLRPSSLNVLDWLSKPLDVPSLLRTLRPSIARNGSTRLRVLHLDDDPDVLGIVAQALNGDAQVVSVALVEDARRALAASHFDLAVIDLALDGRSGLDLLPELYDSAGEAIPVIVYSAQCANSVCAAQVQAALTKSRASIDSLIANLRKRVAVPSPHAPEEREPT